MMRGMELVDIFLFLIGLNGILLSTSSMFSLHFQRKFSIQDIIRFVQSDQSCDFFLQEIPSLIRQDNLTSDQNEGTCILLTSFDNSSSNETIRLSSVVVKVYANVKKYEFSVMPNQCKGNNSFNEIQIHVLCLLTEIYNVTICDDVTSCNAEKEFCRKLFEGGNEIGLCIAQRNLFESCDEDMICTQTTKCENRTCHCKNGFEVMGGTCLPVGMSLNESCSHDRQCTGTTNAGRCLQNNQRPGGVCSCNPGFLQEGFDCLQINKTLFETCEVDNQCNVTLGLGICNTVGVRKVCVCGPQYTENTTSLTCQKVGKKIFETCTMDARCTRTKNADVCKYNTETQANSCACRDGFECVNASCVPICRQLLESFGRQLLESCEYDLQCNGTANATVCGLFGNRSICFCNKGMFEFNGTCIEAGKGLGESCEIDRQCTETLHAGVCDENSSCSCDIGFIREDKDCIRGGWNEEIIYRFMFVGAGGLLFGIFYWIVLLVRKCRRNLLYRGGRFVVQSDQETINRQSTLYAVPSDIRNDVETATLVDRDTRRVANHACNHLNELLENEDNAFSQQIFVEQDPCDDVYNHLHEKESPLCQGVYDVVENVSKRMFQSSEF
ncbi:uncharacterized protein LOC125656176 [Ostrea edulis]|uniref:uncharacterized protein LOC125656176 n=1 Tax=Ostrea edulis TaxID=37623 RepID=UPI002095AFEC|nr:uncharacterized protein LOC125656176 [Ostrea edulis]